MDFKEIQKNDYLEMLSKLYDIDMLKSEKKQIAKDMLKVRRRLKTKLTEYKFLEELIGIETHYTIMEKAVKSYLNHLGFTNIHHTGKDKNEEDLRWFIGDDKLVIIEVSASDGGQAGEDTVGQITKRMGVRKKQYENLEILGCTIVSHDFKRSFKKRHNSPFTDTMKEYAEHSKISLVTTTDLIYAFIDIKNGNIKPEVLIDVVCTPGIFKDNWIQHKLVQSASKG